MTNEGYADKYYEEFVGIIRLLKEGLEEIASDDSYNKRAKDELAVEILQSMEDVCKQSELIDIRNLPKHLNT